jgi:RNA polymerase sigma-70 factor (ECF subfamily)
MENKAPALDELLSHARWLSELARHLARPDVAEDAIQLTWLAAMRSPPADGETSRPWLARVMRNFVRQRGRAESRRGKYERAASGDFATAGADVLYERMAVERALATRVMALDEPERRVVLLRYYQGLSAAAIARQLDIPAGTVRWRLKTALDRLRAELDAGEQKDRWRALVAAAGGAVMVTKTQLGLSVVGALALLAGGVSIPFALSSGRSPSRPGAGGSTADVPGTAPPMAEASRPAARALAQESLPPPRFLAAPARRRMAALPPALAQSGPGELDKQTIRDGIRAVIAPIKACFEAQLDRDPTLQSARVTVHFVIQPRDGKGVITEATIVPASPDAGVPDLAAPLAEQCILQAVSTASFPPPPDGQVIVEYPFMFAR